LGALVGVQEGLLLVDGLIVGIFVGNKVGRSESFFVELAVSSVMDGKGEGLLVAKDGNLVGVVVATALDGIDDGTFD
jgi:hypothetical protein